ncbi:MAG: response regulator transcription factor [Blautia sp.]
MEQAKILIVDDNHKLCALLDKVLRQEGYHHIRTVLSCMAAEAEMEREKPDLMILDVNFPGEDGFSFFQRIRARWDLPVLFLSARDEGEDRITGLGLGADDYMTKPFLPKELTLRMNAILRRTYREEQTSYPSYWIGRREVDLSAGLVRIPEGEKIQEVGLTNKEFQLLKLFLENRGRILTFDLLSESVWGENYYGYENTLMVHIRKLREKIEENPSSPRYLLTVRGLGYRLAKD